MSIPVPFLNIDRIYKRYGPELVSCVESVFSHGQVLMGPEIASFESLIAKRCNRRHAVAVGSCTDALFFALESVGVNPGDEVLVTGYSFIASVSCIIRAGAIPVFVDIDPDDFMMSIKNAESKITAKTKAMVAVHLFGQALSIDVWENFCNRHNLALIEDGAQSLGSSYKGIPVGKMGQASCISFDPTKVVGAFGNGGVLLTDDPVIAENVKKLHYHGKDPSGDFAILGYNSRMGSLQAALLSRQLEWFDEWVNRPKR
jgi:dTDP-4-amino-4,6-dideoxygalactose transaminase